MATTWKVTIWRIGSGCGNFGEARTMRAAYKKALDRSAPYVTGINGSNGERYGRDLTETFNDCFVRASKLMRGNRSCPFASAEDEWKSACVDIQRI